MARLKGLYILDGGAREKIYTPEVRAEIEKHVEMVGGRRIARVFLGKMECRARR